VRRHPLTALRRDAARLGALALLVAGCALGAQAGPSASSPAAVTVSTAPGESLAFVPADVRIEAGAPVRLTFHNASTVAHNLVFTTGIDAATDTIVQPGRSETLSIGPLADGTYRFVCTIHEEMAGELSVGSATQRTGIARPG
jgi:plastocyanin